MLRSYWSSEEVAQICLATLRRVLEKHPECYEHSSDCRKWAIIGVIDAVSAGYDIETCLFNNYTVKAKCEDTDQSEM